MSRKRLDAKLKEQIGRRKPTHLHAVIVEAPAEERIVDEGRILEVPVVLMDIVQVADA